MYEKSIISVSGNAGESYIYTHCLFLTLSYDAIWWTTLVSLIICIFAMNIGIESLPFQLASEYFPTTIRSQVICWDH